MYRGEAQPLLTGAGAKATNFEAEQVHTDSVRMRSCERLSFCHAFGGLCRDDPLGVWSCCPGPAPKTWRAMARFCAASFGFVDPVDLAVSLIKESGNFWIRGPDHRRYASYASEKDCPGRLIARACPPLANSQQNPSSAIVNFQIQIKWMHRRASLAELHMVHIYIYTHRNI